MDKYIVQVLTLDGVLLETRHYDNVDEALIFRDYINHCTENYAEIFEAGW